MNYICFVCENEVKDSDDFEWFGLDGDKIHKRCKHNINRKMNMIDNMGNKEFKNWLEK